MTFARRRIEATITLAKGKFGEDKGDTVTLRGLRMRAQMNAYGGESMTQLQLSIFGLPAQVMAQLTTIGAYMTERRMQNRVQVAAGEDGGALSLIFDGNIDTAFADYSAAPDVVFTIAGFAGGGEALKPVAALSFKGTKAVAEILSGLAATAGLTFENSGVDSQITNAYLPGTTLEQIRRLCRAARVHFNIDRGTLAVWPEKGFRAGDPPLIAPRTGLVGYPAYSGSGIVARTIFLPSARLGGRVRVESDLPGATGTWVTTQAAHDLECENPGGPWFTTLEVGRLEAVS